MKPWWLRRIERAEFKWGDCSIRFLLFALAKLFGKDREVKEKCNPTH